MSFDEEVLTFQKLCFHDVQYVLKGQCHEIFYI
jgi:hypothetical protein